jgi:V/A-type H+-transporting ATPase subunit C
VPQGYGYGNARLRAMHGRLLTEADYSHLLAKVNIEEVITALTETPYKEDIEAALLRVGGVYCVFEALRANLTRTLRKVREFFEGEPRALVDLLLRRWDRHNLLTVLRGQSQEVSPETVLSALIPVGQLDAVSLRELARQPGLRAVIDLMTTWRLPYAKALRRVQARTGTVPDLDQLELALNRFHYASMRDALRQGNGNRAIVLEHLQVEVDLINISTVLRLAHLPDIAPLVHRRYNATDVRPLLIEPGGHLAAPWLAELVAEAGSLEGMVRGLSDSRYGQALQAGWRRYQVGEGGIAVLERELERWQAERIAAMFTRNPLSITIPIGYLGCKEIEIANLRLVAQAVALGMKREQVRRDLIAV